MARRKARWADGDTRSEPFVYLNRAQAAALGFPPFANPAFEGDFFDSEEVARRQLLARYRQSTTTDPPDELGCRWWVGVGAFVVYHVAVWLHLILVGAFD